MDTGRLNRGLVPVREIMELVLMNIDRTCTTTRQQQRPGEQNMTQQDKIATEIDEDADYTCDDLYDDDRMEPVGQEEAVYRRLASLMPEDARMAWEWMEEHDRAECVAAAAFSDGVSADGLIGDARRTATLARKVLEHMARKAEVAP